MTLEEFLKSDRGQRAYLRGTYLKFLDVPFYDHFGDGLYTAEQMIFERRSLGKPRPDGFFLEHNMITPLWRDED